ncbi:TPA: hypothetical protein DIU27_01710 [Candidatus Collierbacteria bacterium]|uniref:Uncharacterized protein n=1 Tax=Candidatus Collierbacteria bacterium GW2011_GWB2_44_22 TaxID=1618387 RepID=A0A0G1HVS7_9BACT|nr:MAG: hypothetical protein UW31_C0012G0004 [Candidatus Collierbacteria bacterium GW2011_GWA2_44_13]KKT51181.1 MAG: hypothetical protein UW44_C0015G0052 [Candidatus Collierbacteria bacterium GW2011_GWB2_44_22]KKT61264.1 MAG: hypothetical protein UW56_C0029G0004 [Candidatus Collierbacteria bacterium GW2011_GWD1_44_27]KKT65982.1 MAG: hypothetical protein UW58_C0015G0004 [Candidatus Collierbacteria bacterium GW2011_GWC2_44_30]KKT68253.1 MAG: hypothetical protein UW64_C0025G0004 [Microgenomates gr
MSKIKSLHGKCTNHCKEGFSLFVDEKSCTCIVKEFPFLKVIGVGVEIVGKKKKEFRVIKCDRLNEEGCCSEQPQNAPAWCKIRS